MMASSAAAALDAVEPEKKKRNVKYTCTCAILASMASMILGYDIGVLSGAALYIKKDLKITDVQLEILMGVINLYSLIGSFAAGRTSDWIGRRYTVVLTAAVFLAGALLMGFAANYTMLMAGQFVAGVGVGYAIVIPPVYAAEISPPSARGLLSSIPEVFANIGILLGYLSNYAFARLPLHLGWRAMLGVSAVPSVLLALMALTMPESPRWLVLKGRFAEARVVLERIADTPQAAAECLADIMAAAGIVPDDNLNGDDAFVTTVPNKRSGSEEKQVWKELVVSPTPAMRRILLSALGIHFFQQASGIDAFVLYSPSMFRSMGITGDSRVLGATCALGAIRLVFTMVATFLLDRVGRRPLLLGSMGGMAVALVGLATGLAIIGNHQDAKQVPWAIGLAMASALAHNVSYSMGLGTITFVYTSEIFPLRVRALGCALGVALNRIISAVVTMTFLSMTKAITIGDSFFLYAGVAVLAWVFFFTCLPETRGRTLEEMSKLFGMADDTGMAKAEEHATRKRVIEIPK